MTARNFRPRPDRFSSAPGAWDENHMRVGTVLRVVSVIPGAEPYGEPGYQSSDPADRITFVVADHGARGHFMATSEAWARSVVPVTSASGDEEGPLEPTAARKCPEGWCDGSGYIVARNAEGGTQVEACDFCGLYGSDDEAEAAYKSGEAKVRADSGQTVEEGPLEPKPRPRRHRKRKAEQDPAKRPLTPTEEALVPAGVKWIKDRLPKHLKLMESRGIPAKEEWIEAADDLLKEWAQDTLPKIPEFEERPGEEDPDERNIEEIVAYYQPIIDAVMRAAFGASYDAAGCPFDAEGPLEPRAGLLRRAGTWKLPFEEAAAKQLSEIVQRAESGEPLKHRDLLDRLYDVLGDDELSDLIGWEAKGSDDATFGIRAARAIRARLQHLLNEYDVEPWRFTKKFEPAALSILRTIANEQDVSGPLEREAFMLPRIDSLWRVKNGFRAYKGPWALSHIVDDNRIHVGSILRVVNLVPFGPHGDMPDTWVAFIVEGREDRGQFMTGSGTWKKYIVPVTRDSQDAEGPLEREASLVPMDELSDWRIERSVGGEDYELSCSGRSPLSDVAHMISLDPATNHFEFLPGRVGEFALDPVDANLAAAEPVDGEADYRIAVGWVDSPERRLAFLKAVRDVRGLRGAEGPLEKSAAARWAARRKRYVLPRQPEGMVRMHAFMPGQISRFEVYEGYKDYPYNEETDDLEEIRERAEKEFKAQGAGGFWGLVVISQDEVEMEREALREACDGMAYGEDMAGPIEPTAASKTKRAIGKVWSAQNRQDMFSVDFFAADSREEVVAAIADSEQFRKWSEEMKKPAKEIVEKDYNIAEHTLYAIGEAPASPDFLYAAVDKDADIAEVYIARDLAAAEAAVGRVWQRQGYSIREFTVSYTAGPLESGASARSRWLRRASPDEGVPAEEIGEALCEGCGHPPSSHRKGDRECLADGCACYGYSGREHDICANLSCRHADFEHFKFDRFCEVPGCGCEGFKEVDEEGVPGPLEASSRSRWTRRAAPDDDALALSRAFIAVINEWLTPKEIRLVVRRNRINADPLSCATHDFCDANMAMFEAYVKTFGREPELQSDADMALMNRAWDLAKDAQFGVHGMEPGPLEREAVKADPKCGTLFRANEDIQAKLRGGPETSIKAGTVFEYRGRSVLGDIAAFEPRTTPTDKSMPFVYLEHGTWLDKATRIGLRPGDWGIGDISEGGPLEREAARLRKAPADPRAAAEYQRVVEDPKSTEWFEALPQERKDEVERVDDRISSFMQVPGSEAPSRGDVDLWLRWVREEIGITDAFARIDPLTWARGAKTENIKRRMEVVDEPLEPRAARKRKCSACGESGTADEFCPDCDPPLCFSCQKRNECGQCGSDQAHNTAEYGPVCGVCHNDLDEGGSEEGPLEPTARSRWLQRAAIRGFVWQPKPGDVFLVKMYNTPDSDLFGTYAAPDEPTLVKFLNDEIEAMWREDEGIGLGIPRDEYVVGDERIRMVRVFDADPNTDLPLEPTAAVRKAEHPSMSGNWPCVCGHRQGDHDFDDEHDYAFCATDGGCASNCQEFVPVNESLFLRTDIEDNPLEREGSRKPRKSCDRCYSVPGEPVRDNDRSIIEAEYKNLCEGCRLTLTGNYCNECGQPTYGHGVTTPSGHALCERCTWPDEGFEYEELPPRRQKLIDDALERRQYALKALRESGGKWGDEGGPLEPKAAQRGSHLLKAPLRAWSFGEHVTIPAGDTIQLVGKPKRQPPIFLLRTSRYPKEMYAATHRVAEALGVDPVDADKIELLPEGFGGIVEHSPLEPRASLSKLASLEWELEDQWRDPAGEGKVRLYQAGPIEHEGKDYYLAVERGPWNTWIRIHTPLGPAEWDTLEEVDMPAGSVSLRQAEALAERLFQTSIVAGAPFVYPTETHGPLEGASRGRWMARRADKWRAYFYRIERVKSDGFVDFEAPDAESADEKAAEMAERDRITWSEGDYEVLDEQMYRMFNMTRIEFGQKGGMDIEGPIEPEAKSRSRWIRRARHPEPGEEWAWKAAPEERVHIDRVEGGFVYFFPAGGGFGKRGPIARFLNDFTPAEGLPEQLLKGEFAWDGLEGVSFQGYYWAGQSWNGWAVPYLPLEQGLRVVETMNSDPEANYGLARFDKRRKVFVFQDDPKDKESRYEVHAEKVKGVDVPLYNFGNGWTWMRVGGDEPAKMSVEDRPLEGRSRSRWVRRAYDWEAEFIKACRLAGFEAEMGGGGAATLILQLPDDRSIQFGFVNGPLGYNVFKPYYPDEDDVDTNGDVATDERGYALGGEMDKEDATAEEMAAFIRDVALKYGAFQKWPNRRRRDPVWPGGLEGEASLRQRWAAKRKRKPKEPDTWVMAYESPGEPRGPLQGPLFRINIGVQPDDYNWIKIDAKDQLNRALAAHGMPDKVVYWESAEILTPEQEAMPIWEVDGPGITEVRKGPLEQEGSRPRAGLVRRAADSDARAAFRRRSEIWKALKTMDQADPAAQDLKAEYDALEEAASRYVLQPTFASKRGPAPWDVFRATRPIPVRTDTLVESEIPAGTMFEYRGRSLRGDILGLTPYWPAEGRMPGVAAEHGKWQDKAEVVSRSKLTDTGWLQGDWGLHGGSVDEHSGPLEKESALKVPVRVFSDSHEVEFSRPDASEWLKSLPADQLAKLEAEGWCGCELADEFAYWLESKGDADAKRLFKHLKEIRGLRAYKDMGGFEVVLDIAAADAWYAARGTPVSEPGPLEREGANKKKRPRAQDATAVIDWSVPVANFVDDAASPEDAFDMAADFKHGVAGEVADSLKAELGAGERRVKVVSVAFSECDSANPAHAAAHYDVEVRGPHDLVVKFVAATMFEGSRVEAEEYVAAGAEQSVRDRGGDVELGPLEREAAPRRHYSDFVDMLNRYLAGSPAEQAIAIGVRDALGTSGADLDDEDEFNRYALDLVRFYADASDHAIGNMANGQSLSGVAEDMLNDPDKGLQFLGYTIQTNLEAGGQPVQDWVLKTIKGMGDAAREVLGLYGDPETGHGPLEREAVKRKRGWRKAVEFYFCPLCDVEFGVRTECDDFNSASDWECDDCGSFACEGAAVWWPRSEGREVPGLVCLRWDPKAWEFEMPQGIEPTTGPLEPEASFRQYNPPSKDDLFHLSEGDEQPCERCDKDLEAGDVVGEIGGWCFCEKCYLKEVMEGDPFDIIGPLEPTAGKRGPLDNLKRVCDHAEAGPGKGWCGRCGGRAPDRTAAAKYPPMRSVWRTIEPFVSHAYEDAEPEGVVEIPAGVHFVVAERGGIGHDDQPWVVVVYEADGEERRVFDSWPKIRAVSEMVGQEERGGLEGGDVKTEFQVGDWVRDHYGRLGEVYDVHPCYESVKAKNPDFDYWFAGQERPASEKDQPWYDISVHGGGAVMVAEEHLSPAQPPREGAAGKKVDRGEPGKAVSRAASRRGWTRRAVNVGFPPLERIMRLWRRGRPGRRFSYSTDGRSVMYGEGKVLEGKPEDFRLFMDMKASQDAALIGTAILAEQAPGYRVWNYDGYLWLVPPEVRVIPGAKMRQVLRGTWLLDGLDPARFIGGRLANAGSLKGADEVLVGRQFVPQKTDPAYEEEAGRRTAMIELMVPFLERVRAGQVSDDERRAIRSAAWLLSLHHGNEVVGDGNAADAILKAIEKAKADGDTRTLLLIGRQGMRLFSKLPGVTMMTEGPLESDACSRSLWLTRRSAWDPATRRYVHDPAYREAVLALGEALTGHEWEGAEAFPDKERAASGEAIYFGGGYTRVRMRDGKLVLLEIPEDKAGRWDEAITQREALERILAGEGGRTASAGRPHAWAGNTELRKTTGEVGGYPFNEDRREFDAWVDVPVGTLVEVHDVLNGLAAVTWPKSPVGPDRFVWVSDMDLNEASELVGAGADEPGGIEREAVAA